MSWLKPKAAAEFAGISERTIRDWLKNGLRHSRLPSGSILIQRIWLDEFLQAFEVSDREVDTIVEGVLKEMQP